MDKKRRSRSVVMGLLAVLTGLLFYVWQHIQVVCMGYRINDLKKAAHSLGEKNMRLRREVSEFTNYETVERIAGRLNMVYPEREDLVYLIE